MNMWLAAQAPTVPSSQTSPRMLRQLLRRLLLVAHPLGLTPLPLVNQTRVGVRHVRRVLCCAVLWSPVFSSSSPFHPSIPFPLPCPCSWPAGDASTGSAPKTVLPLLVPCPNASMQHGENRDKLVLKSLPAAPAQALDLLKVRRRQPFLPPLPPLLTVVVLFGMLASVRLLRACFSCIVCLSVLGVTQCLGLLMGCAIRTRALMPLSLPALFWKPLVGMGVGLPDLEAVAQSLVRGVIQPLRTCASEDEFKTIFGEGNLRW